MTESGFRSRSANSWLLGRKLRGAVLKTVADGRVVHGVMTAPPIPSELERYLDRLVEVLEAHATIDAVYLVGSAALGAYEHGRSDVDVVAVTARSLSLDERLALAEAVEEIPVPARKLELVVYPHGSDRWELNLNPGDHVGVDPDAEPSFWFVLDRAIAEQHATPLVGPSWGELFAARAAGGDRGRARRSGRVRRLGRSRRRRGARRRPRTGLARDRPLGLEARGLGVAVVSAFLALEDGTIFRGTSVGAAASAFGEAVFTTAMTGYQETVTDPSFAEQLVCFTAPMVGNYGVAAGRAESTGRPREGGADARGAGPGMDGLAGGEWDRRADRDRHALARAPPARGRRHARRRGSGRLDEAEALDAVRARPTMEGAALVAQVSAPEPYVYCDAGTLRVAVLDYGCKRSILRRLAGAGAHVTVFPHDVDAGSCSPTTPSSFRTAPATLSRSSTRSRSCRELLGRIPVLGICLGHQLLGLATGHGTYKLPFGHRGANHPVLERSSGRVLVTSQNHGFAVAPSEKQRRRTSRSTTARSRASTSPSCRRARCSSTRRRARGPTTPGRSWSTGSEEVRDAA